MALTYEPIATTTLSGSQSTIDFTSISASYTDLKLVVVPITSTAATLRIGFNSDTGTNYSRTQMDGDGTTATSGRSTSANNIALGLTSATIPVLQTVDIFSYAGSTNKTTLGFFANDYNGSGNVRVNVGLWRSTSAITAINLTLNTGSFSAGTTATLYGITAA